VTSAQAALSSEIPHISVMTIRTRKFFGAIALIVLAAVWALVGMAVAQMPFLAQSGLLQAMWWPAWAGCCRRCRS
jgi:hypothetical protein